MAKHLRGHGINIQQQRRPSPLLRDLRIKDVSLPEAHFKALTPLRVLVQQVAQIGRRGVSSGEGEEQEVPRFRIRQVSLGVC